MDGRGKNLVRKVRKLWAYTGAGLTVGFVAWCWIAYQASESARAALETDQNVAVSRGDGYWTFAPATATNRVSDGRKSGFLFFPGSLVEPAAYAPLLRSIASKGYPTILVELPRRGVFGGADEPAINERARNGMKQFAGVKHWVTGGHSLGGLVAARFVKEKQNDSALSGLVLVGTSHPRDFSLSHLTIPVVKILGSRDGLASVAKSEATRQNLPTAARLLVIEGGNHSQFGWYGFQPGDKFATITRAQQQERTVTAILELMETN